MYDSNSYLITFTGDVLVVLDLVIDESQLKTGAAREVLLRAELLCLFLTSTCPYLGIS